jgi:glutaredoxin 3
LSRRWVNKKIEGDFMASVKVYSSSTCPHCQHAKKFLQNNNVDFEDFDVTSNREKLEEIMEKSGQMGVPVIDVNGKIIIGFDETELRKALNL